MIHSVKRKTNDGNENAILKKRKFVDSKETGVIPDELLFRINEFLSHRDLLRLEVANKSSYFVSNDDKSWFPHLPKKFSIDKPGMAKLYSLNYIKLSAFKSTATLENLHNLSIPQIENLIVKNKLSIVLASQPLSKKNILILIHPLVQEHIEKGIDGITAKDVIDTTTNSYFFNNPEVLNHPLVLEKLKNKEITLLEVINLSHEDSILNLNNEIMNNYLKNNKISFASLLEISINKLEFLTHPLVQEQIEKDCGGISAEDIFESIGVVSNVKMLNHPFVIEKVKNNEISILEVIRCSNEYTLSFLNNPVIHKYLIQNKISLISALKFKSSQMDFLKHPLVEKHIDMSIGGISAADVIRVSFYASADADVLDHPLVVEKINNKEVSILEVIQHTTRYSISNLNHEIIYKYLVKSQLSFLYALDLFPSQLEYLVHPLVRRHIEMGINGISADDVIEALGPINYAKALNYPVDLEKLKNHEIDLLDMIKESSHSFPKDLLKRSEFIIEKL